MYLEGNRSKSSLEIDLRADAGRRQFRDLARRADVVIENARAGVWDGMGLGEDDLHELNSRLVYARAKGFGVEGPSAGLRAFEHVLQAMSGIQITQGGSGAPRMMTIPASDYASPLYLAIGILCSLFEGRRNGTWPTVSASLAVAASVYEAEHLTRIDGKPAVRDHVGDDLRGPSADRRIYCVADGWVTVCAVSAEQRAALASALDVDAVEVAVLDEALRHRSVDDVVALLTAAGVPAARSVGPREVVSDPQVAACNLLVTSEHPKIGRVVQVGIPYSLSRNRPRIQGPAPVMAGDASRWPTEVPGALAR
jgi:formyl-CoA transferase